MKNHSNCNFFEENEEKIWIVRKNAYLCNPKRENNVRETK